MDIDKLSKNIFFKELLDKYKNNVFNMILNELNFIDNEKIDISKILLEEFFNELCFDERCEIIEKFYTNFKELLNDKDFVKKLNFSNLEVNQYKIYIKNFETQRSLNESITILYDLIPKLDSLCTQININNEDINELKSFKNMYEENDRKTLYEYKQYIDKLIEQGN